MTINKIRGLGCHPGIAGPPALWNKDDDYEQAWGMLEAEIAAATAASD